MILITGATGTNGRELIQQLTASGHRVRAMVRNPAKSTELAAPNVELIAGDFEQPASLDAALKGVDRAFLLTPVSAHAVKWQTAFIEAAKRAGVRYLLKFSGMGATQANPSEIMRQHAKSDSILQRSGIPHTILQPNSFYQNTLWSAGTIKGANAFYLPFKDAKQSVVDVRDINAIAAKVLTGSGHEGKTYLITGPEALTCQQMAETLTKVLDRPIHYVNVPLSAAEDGMRQMHMPEWNVKALSDLYDYFASGAAASVTDTVRQLLGRPPITFEQFCRDHQAAFQP